MEPRFIDVSAFILFRIWTAVCQFIANRKTSRLNRLFSIVCVCVFFACSQGFCGDELKGICEMLLSDGTISGLKTTMPNLYTRLNSHVRYPDEQISDLQYFTKYVESAEGAMSFLHLALDNPSFDLVSKYSDFIKTQHYILMNDYGGFMYGEGSQKNPRPGQFLFELVGEDSSFGHKSVLLDKKESRLDLSEFTGDEFVTDIEDVKKEFGTEKLPVNTKRFFGAYEHTYPIRFQQEYLSLLPKKLLQIRSAIELHQNAQEILPLLADYYQIAINTHLFLRGNNSIFMGHVNVILKKIGLKPVNHGNLDYKALVYNSSKFRSEFREHVIEQQY